MFNFIGKDAVDGAVSRMGELIAGLDAQKINDGLSKLAEKTPIVGIFLKAFNSMSEEEQVDFVKNCMIAGAKAAAKV